MKLIVALGNPGEKYSLTRHNAGFIYADNLAAKWGASFNFESKFNAQIAKCNFDSQQIWIVKPQTFMNLSGQSVQAIVNFYKLDASDVFVVYDDIATNLGGLRFRESGSDGGHNGIKSIISLLGSAKFDRLKIGIGPQPKFMASESYVLQNFSAEECEELDKVVKKAALATECYLENDFNLAQSKFNCK